MSETKDTQIGVFIPIGNNGWIISETSPTYLPTFDLNKEIVVKAEKYGFDFALSMIKMRGYGGVTQHWDYNLESFTLMAGLAAVTSKINLFASTPVLVLPPSSRGTYRYEYATELLPKPSHDIKLIAAGQSGPGTAFAANYADYNFTSGSGINQPTAFKEANSRLVEAAKGAGRDVGALVLMMIIADETDEAAHAKFEFYNKGTDLEALAWMRNQSGKDVKADDFSTAKRMVNMSGNSTGSLATLIGSWEKVAKMLDEAAMQPIKGIMLASDDFVQGVEDFGTYVQRSNR